jgi:hypothetical protein
MVEKNLNDIKKELEILDDMLSSLVDLLIEKNIITDEEWEKKVKEKLKESEKLERME